MADEDDEFGRGREKKGRRFLKVLQRRGVCAAVRHLPLARVSLFCCAFVCVALFVVRTAATAAAGDASSAALLPRELRAAGYGYNGSIDRLRATEFPQLAKSVYLDFMGAGQYQATQLREICTDLSGNLYGNAHSLSDCSRRSEAAVNAVRSQLLRYFGLQDDSIYTCVFTSGATGGLKLVGDAFPFVKGGKFVLLTENHNSVLGIREIALGKGADFAAVDDPTAASAAEAFSCDAGGAPAKTNLFAFPAEENFAGAKFPVAEWTKFVHGLSRPECRWKVLLDAAALAPTNPLDLGALWRMGPAHAPEFVVVSFYKMMGFPTGAGALLVRNDALPLLHQPYWGGGQVLIALPGAHFMVPASGKHEQLEAGTINFLSIAAVRNGLGALVRLGGPKAIQDHTWALTQWLYKEMAKTVHSAGSVAGSQKRPVFEIYGNHASGNRSQQGAIITFNVLRRDGSYVGFGDVAEAAEKAGFHLRTGCMCNPGACYAALRHSNVDIIQFAHDYASAPSHNDIRINGRPVGAVRLSIGYPTTFAELSNFLTFARRTFAT